MKIVQKFDGVFLINKKIATINLIPGYTPFGEKLIKNKVEYRIWDPYRSKWAAAILKGIKKFPLKKGDKVLYLGAASGQSASYISDIVGKNGLVFCVDISKRVMRDLIFLCKKRNNMIPILADASNPDEYEIVGKVDFIFQDVAVRNQVGIILKNKKFLKENGYAMIAIKSRSIDVSAKPSDVFKNVEKELKKYFLIIDKKRLEPYEKDHIVFLLTPQDSHEFL